MSRVIEYRTHVIESFREALPELREIDWYDGLFDEADLKQWSIKVPGAMVAVTNADDELISTGETQIDLDNIMVVIDQDRKQPRDADTRVWEVLEKAAIHLRLQTFGYANASAASSVRFKRLKDPAMRRMGVAVGVIQWRSGVTIGTNKSREREYLRDFDGNPIFNWPDTITGRIAANGGAYDAISSDPDLTALPAMKRPFVHPWDEPQ